MGKSNDDGWKNLNNPPRKQDPYVTGGSGSGDGNKNDGCADRTATLVIATVALGLTVRALVRGRR